MRGAIGSLLQLFVVFGLLFDYCIGPYVPYMWLSTATAIFPVLFVAAMIWVPESPYYLINNDRMEDAQKSLMWLRGQSREEIAQELKVMQVLGLLMVIPLKKINLFLLLNVFCHCRLILKRPKVNPAVLKTFLQPKGPSSHSL